MLLLVSQWVFYILFLCSLELAIVILLLCDVSPIQNVGLHFETWNAGILGPVKLSGLNEGTRDLTKQKMGIQGLLTTSITLIYQGVSLDSQAWFKKITRSFACVMFEERNKAKGHMHLLSLFNVLFCVYFWFPLKINCNHA